MSAQKTSESKRYFSGDIVFAKLKGYPWWPAKIEEECNVPKTVLETKNKRKSSSSSYTVFFFGSLDYAFFSENLLRPFDQDKVQEDIRVNKYKNKNLVESIHQALDTINSSSITITSISKAISPPSSESNGTKPTRKRTMEADGSSLATIGNKVKKRCGAPSTKDTESIIGNLRLQPLMQKPKYLQVAATKSPEYEKIFKRVYGYRHKLQKLIYGKKPGDIPVSDHTKIDGILKGIVRCDMTNELLKDTKIAKVMRIGCEYEFGKHDTYKLQHRCLDIMKTWESILPNQQDNRIVSTSTVLLKSPTAEVYTLSAAPGKKAVIVNDNVNALRAASSSSSLKQQTVNPNNILELSTDQHTQINPIRSGKMRHWIEDAPSESESHHYSNGNVPQINKKVLPLPRIISWEQIRNTSNRLPIIHSNANDVIDGPDHQTHSRQNDINKKTDNTLNTLSSNHRLVEWVGNTDPSSTTSPTTMTDNNIPLPQVFSTEEKGRHQQ